MTAPGLFEGTASYYARYRPGYPPDALDTLVERFDLSPCPSVLDLGCGTGQLALPLARRGIPVHAIDPDSDMLAEGERVAVGGALPAFIGRSGTTARCSNSVCLR